MFVNFNILNQLGSPAINSNTFANRPAAGQTGRLFVSTDTFEIYRDNGTTWDLIGGPGSSTITGTGTATQVAYFTSSQAIGSSADLYWDNTNTRLGIGTSSPGVRLDVHGTGVMMHINSTSGTSNSLMSFQRTGTNVWRLGDNYNAGDNYFELRNSVLSNDALTIQATTNKAAFLSQQTYSTGQAQGALFTYNLTAPAGTTFATPNALSAVNAFLNLSLGGNATLPAGTRQGIEGNSRVSFTGAGTLTMSQGSTLRAYAAITGVHSFAGSAVGTITHLAGIRLCFPDNIGSAINITNNYGLLINDQSAGTGTITYTNRWGIYQEGASDLNYFAANLLIGSTVNNGAALQVTGTATISNSVTAQQGIFRNSGVPAIQVIRDLNVTVFGTVGQGIEFGALNGSTPTAGASIYGTLDNPATTGSLIFQTLNAGNLGTRMLITSGGNVLIGTTTDAGQKLQVNGSASFNGTLLGFDGTYGTNYGCLSFTNNTNGFNRIFAGLNNYDGIYIAAGTGQSINFWTNGQTGAGLVINSGGAADFSSSIKTAAPNTGTAAAWKLGSRVAATVVVNTTEYIEIDIGGTLYKLATVT